MSFLKKIHAGNILLSLLCSMAFALLGLRLVLALSYLPETGGVSINVLYGIARLSGGHPLYTSPELPPFPIIQYMPLHFYLVSGIAQLTGNGGDVHALMVINRLLCLLFDLFSVMVIVYTLRRILFIPAVLSWAMSCIYFLMIPGILYGRSDNLYLLFFLVTLAILLKSFLYPRSKALQVLSTAMLAGIFSALAFFSKQTGIFLVGFCTLHYMITERSLKNLLAYAGGVLICGGMLGVLFLTESFAAVKMNVVDGVKNGINAGWFIEVILKNFFLKFSYVIAAGFLTAYLLFRSGQDIAARMLATGIVFFFLIALLTTFKAGSGPNYFMEFIAFSILGMAYLIRKTENMSTTAVVFALALSPFFLLASANDKGWGDVSQMKKMRADYQDCIAVKEYILPRLSADEWVLTDFHKESLVNICLSDKALFPCREVALYFTYPLGVFRFEAFAGLVQSGKIPFLVFGKKDAPESFLEVSLENYKPEKEFGRYIIYRYQAPSMTD